MRLQFSVLTLVLLTALVAGLLGWYIDHRRLSVEVSCIRAELETVNKEKRFDEYVREIGIIQFESSDELISACSNDRVVIQIEFQDRKCVFVEDRNPRPTVGSMATRIRGIAFNKNIMGDYWEQFTDTTLLGVGKCRYTFDETTGVISFFADDNNGRKNKLVFEYNLVAIIP